MNIKKIYRYFKEVCVSTTKATPEHLILWYYEDSLKKLYFEFIQLLEELSHDNLEYVKNKSLSSIYELLVAKPEQEKNLLTLLVNKLVSHIKNINIKYKNNINIIYIINLFNNTKKKEKNNKTK